MTILSLKTLTLGEFELDSESTELFFDTCQQLQELSLLSTKFSLSNSFNRWEKFPSIKSLSFNYVDNLTPKQQLEIIKRCPQIKSLYWIHGPRKLERVCELCQVLAEDCPLLEELNLDEWNLFDEDCSSIIDSSVRLTAILMSTSKFGPKALNSCSRYFSTLTGLDVSGCVNSTSPMVQHVMTSCHHLRKFDAYILNAQDILGIVEEIQVHEEEESEPSPTPITTMTASQPRQKDWICSDLRSLSLFIGGLEGKPRDWQERVLRQIARLSKLKILYVGCLDSNTFEPSNGLNLRLETGLNILKSLIHLEDFSFHGLLPEMEKEEVR
ncbi:hypothetical protein BGZ46_003128 [Entomortierella lignicola]|nr:hypothetical protein BGZ46_003128 [Entomortierella lignicola]